DDGPVEPRTVCGNFLEGQARCVAGDVVGLSSAFRPPTPQTPPVPIFAGGSAVVGVTPYPGPFGFAGEINLLGDAVTLPAPPGEALNEHITVTAPFTLTGDLQGWVIIARDAKMVFDLPLVGHGTATLELVTNPGPNGPTMGLFRLTYVFENGSCSSLRSRVLSREVRKERALDVNDHAHQHHRLHDDRRHLPDPLDRRIARVDVALNEGVRDHRLRASDVRPAAAKGIARYLRHCEEPQHAEAQAV